MWLERSVEGARKMEGAGEELKESVKSIAGFHFSFSSLYVNFV